MFDEFRYKDNSFFKSFASLLSLTIIHKESLES